MAWRVHESGVDLRRGHSQRQVLAHHPVRNSSGVDPIGNAARDGRNVGEVTLPVHSPCMTNRNIGECFRKCQRLLVGLQGRMGLRVSEATEAGRSLLRVDEDEILIYGKGAGGKYRTVPIPDVLAPLVAEAQAKRADGPLLGVYPEYTARSDIKRMAKRAGVTHADGSTPTSHDLRATFARYVWNQSQDLMVVMELMGHTSPAVTKGYIGTDAAKARKAVN